MPFSTALRKLLCRAPGRQDEEEAEAPARRPLPEPVEAGPAQRGRPVPANWIYNPAYAGPVQPGRPYRDFVESEAERYWQEMVKVGSLTKPNQQEIRAAAIRVLGLAQRYRPGWKPNPALNRAHLAVNAVQLHLVESGRLGHPFTPAEASPNYVEALIQLAHDAGWLAREIPLPDHPPPKHPTIHYTKDPEYGVLVPREDSLIRGDYVYDAMSGSRITQHDYIPPITNPHSLVWMSDLISQGLDAYYTLRYDGRTGSRDRPLDEDAMAICFHWLKTDETGVTTLRQLGDGRYAHYSDNIDIRDSVFPIEHGVQRFDHLKRYIHFSPCPPSQEVMLRNRLPVPAYPGMPYQEIPLPDHPAPHHPPIYYTLDQATGRPIPMLDSEIRRNYVRYRTDDSQVFTMTDILPWWGPNQPNPTNLLSAPVYTLELTGGLIRIMLHSTDPFIWPLQVYRRPLSHYDFYFQH